MNTATIILANDCLQQRNIPPIKLTTSNESHQSDPDPYEVGRRYGPIVRADILTYGYHLPPEWFGKAVPTPRMSAQQEAAMDGPSGCLAASRRELTGSHTLDSPVARQISSKSFVESLEDPKVKAVTADWSACMTKKGYSYKSPLQALSKADLKMPKASAQELHVAAADYSCKVSTDLISTWQKVEIKIQEKEIAKHLPQLNEADAQRAKIMAKAERIIDQGA
ncbi:hypothetical protein GT030_21450 [Streptomyces sp. SID1328]|uniref:hypothetical protein n=1 Tax=Streptomyces sp. SID1328 TaxID=2690250 RepID=UPI001368345C|nr:hypothetical protein [Streptomyces sp. SID1328]MYV41359.1 hypothetical protein [Streptomyces sp. SID1328]